MLPYFSDMIDSKRTHVWPFITFPLVAGALLSVAWWDWVDEGRITAWWHSEHIYASSGQQLRWIVLFAEIVCLGLWWLCLRVDPDTKNSLSGSKTAPREPPSPRSRSGSDDPDRARLDIQSLWCASAPFALAWLVLPFFARYAFHPFGIQYGSSIWIHGLSAVTVIVVAIPASRLLFKWTRAEHRSRAGLVLICSFAVLYASIFCFLSSARHASFRTHALDMGTMDQAAWNTAHGRILERTPLYRHPAQGARYENRLLDAKLELIFIPLSALYGLWADPRILLVTQTLFLAAGAIPLYLLIDDLGANTFLSLVLSAAYLLYLPLHYVTMAEFHPSTLMVPLFIAAWRAMRRAIWPRYYVWLALALCCRIEAAIVLLVLGIVIAVWHKDRRTHGIVTTLVAFIWLIVDLAVIVPAVQRIYGPGAGNLIERRFGALGSTPASIIHNTLTHPLLIAQQFLDREKIQALFDLFTPLGFIPLLFPPALAPALPVLAINLLAESVWQNSIQAHYMAAVIPFLWIASAEGLAWLAHKHRTGWQARLATTLALFIFLNTGLNSFLFSPYPPGRAFRLADFYQSSNYQEALRQVIAFIPDSATVCAQSDLHPHLSQRRDIALFPYCQLEGDTAAEYIVLDLDAASDKSPMDFHAFYELVNQWLEKETFGVVAHQGGALLLQRGAPRANVSDVRAALDKYGQAFYRVDYIESKTPASMRAQEQYRVKITLRNTGSQCWHSKDQLPVRLSYRWHTESNALLAVQPMRTDLPHRVEPGNVVTLKAWVVAPPRPGKYVLEWDMLREGDAWFGDKGGNTLRQEIVVE
ncbi:MAG: DUF2079 domain-containing protein [Anaerolineae bacterium]|nr:DUF2079 domain-containing protein [Anaerolineae bacterium]